MQIILKNLAFIATTIGIVFTSGSARAIGKLYWTDSGTDKIQRANLDGSDVEDLVTGLSDPQGIELDSTNGKMYWIDGQKIQRANLDGSDVEDLVTGLLKPGGGIDLDISNGHIYWNSELLNHSIQRANLDGSDVEDVVILSNEENSLSISSMDIELNVTNDKIYWGTNGKFMRANLDGSGVEDLVTRT